MDDFSAHKGSSRFCRCLVSSDLASFGVKERLSFVSEMVWFGIVKRVTMLRPVSCHKGRL